MEEENIEEEQSETKDPMCSRCGLRTYDPVCPNCGTPIIDKKDNEDDDEEYNWREHKR